MGTGRAGPCPARPLDSWRALSSMACVMGDRPTITMEEASKIRDLMTRTRRRGEGHSSTSPVAAGATADDTCATSAAGLASLPRVGRLTGGKTNTNQRRASLLGGQSIHVMVHENERQA